MPDDKTIETVTKEAIAYIPQAADDVDTFMLSQKNAAEAQFGSVGGSIARYMLSQIEKRSQRNNHLPDEQPATDILHPDLSVGADVILDPGKDRWHLIGSAGQPQGHEGKPALQGTIGFEYDF